MKTDIKIGDGVKCIFRKVRAEECRELQKITIDGDDSPRGRNKGPR